MESSGSEVIVQSRPDRVRWNWSSDGGYSIDVSISLPAQFDAEVRTDDGDISVERLSGDVILKSDDGRHVVAEINCERIDDGVLTCAGEAILEREGPG